MKITQLAFPTTESAVNDQIIHAYKKQWFGKKLVVTLFATKRFPRKAKKRITKTLRDGNELKFSRDAQYSIPDPNSSGERLTITERATPSQIKQAKYDNRKFTRKNYKRIIYDDKLRAILNKIEDSEEKERFKKVFLIK